MPTRQAGFLRINAAHGGGGQLMNGLIRDIFLKHFANETLAALEDAAVLLPASGQKIAFTTDSFVVTPLFFPGGDIGRLAVVRHGERPAHARRDPQVPDCRVYP